MRENSNQLAKWCFHLAGGAKGVKAVASMVMAKDDILPIALFDADGPGLQTIKNLKESLYSNDHERLLVVTDFINLPEAEVEDLFPHEFIARAVDSVFKAAETAFADSAKEGSLIVPQVEQWSAKNGLKLELGWKVDVAKRVKQRMLDGVKVPDDIVERWRQMFETFER